MFAADWICNEGAKPNPDKHSWLYSSAHFAALTSGLLDKNLRDAAIVLVNTAAILYDWGHECPSQNSSTSDLWKSRSIAGTQVLLGLEIALSDKILAKASLDEPKALILVLLGTTVASSYLSPKEKVQNVRYPNMTNVGSSLMILKATLMPMRTVDRFVEVQKQLLKFLLKSIIRIAEAASLIKAKDAKQQLVDNPRRHWIKKAMNDWNSEIELKKIFSSCDLSFYSPGLKERRQCRLVMDTADQGLSAPFPNTSIVRCIGGTCDLPSNVQDDPWPFCQDQQLPTGLEIATPQIIVANGKEYDAIDFQGDNLDVEPSVSQSPESLQPHAEHMVRDYPAIACEHSMCEVYQDEPPAFTSAITDRIWPGNHYGGPE